MTVHGHRFTRSHSLSQKTSGSFGAVKKAADTEFAGGYNVILISVFSKFSAPTIAFLAF